MTSPSGGRPTSVPPKPPQPVDDRIDSAFEGYRGTIDLLQGFCADRSHGEEFAILVCARLDSLANLAAEGSTQAQRFVNFVTAYSSRRADLQQVSLPNLYAYLVRQHDAALYTFEIPGRVRIIDEDDELPFFRFLAQCDLPLTAEAVSGFLRWFSIVIQKKYRTTATQKRTKPSLDRASDVLDLLRDAAASRRSEQYGRAVEKLKPLVNHFSVASILYRDFRSGAIHEYAFSVSEERFFREKGLFFDTVRFVYDPGMRYLDLQFSAAFLLDLFDRCLTNYCKRLSATKKLPLPLFLTVADLMTEAQYLDDAPFNQEERFIQLALGR
jgi:hypothetical protein